MLRAGGGERLSKGLLTAAGAGAIALACVAAHFAFLGRTFFAFFAVAVSVSMGMLFVHIARAGTCHASTFVIFVVHTIE